MNFNEPLIDTIAAACHETNRQYCLSVGDQSLKHWEDTDEAIKASARAGVRHFLKTLCSAKEQHDEWKKYKTEQGYVYGEVKDDEKKTHPCLVEYEELPKSQKVKDVLFQAVITGFLKSEDMEYLEAPLKEPEQA